MPYLGKFKFRKTKLCNFSLRKKKSVNTLHFGTVVSCNVCRDIGTLSIKNVVKVK